MSSTLLSRPASRFLRLLAGALALAAGAGCARPRHNQISNPGSVADDPAIALDGNGHGVGIWTEQVVNPLQPSPVPGGDIVVSLFDANTGFAAPISLYTLDVNTSPRLGMHGDGSARAAWRSETGSSAVSRWKVIAATMSSSGLWTVEPFPESADRPAPLALATNRRGDAMLAWYLASEVFVSFAAPGQGWADPIMIGSQETGNGDTPALAVALNPTGDAVLVRTDQFMGATRVVAHHFHSGSDPYTPIAIDDGFSCELGDYNELKIAATIDPDGFVTTTWIAADGNDGGPTCVNRYDPSTGWQGAALLSAPTAFGSETFVECDLSGAVVAAWSDHSEMLRASFTSATGWGMPVSLGADTNAASLSVAPNGCAIALGLEITGSFGLRLVADVMPPTKGFSGAQRVTDGGSQPDVAMEESGLAVALSVIDARDPFDLSNDRIVVAHVWQAPDVKFETPPAASPGVPVTLDATKTRIRSTDAGIVLCEWDFESDGAVDETYHDANGLRVAHSFPALGTYDVQLHVEDSWGYSATSTLQVVVTDGGDGPPWQLLVQVSGGTGTVVSSDDDGDGVPEINCPIDCEGYFADRHYAFLKATPDPGYTFDHWEGLISDGDMDYGGGEVTIFMYTHRTITAVFR